jgi:uncharacterized membrane protein YgcG
MTPARRTHRLAALWFALVLAAIPPSALALELPPSREGVYVYDLAEIWRPDTEAAAQRIAAGIRDRTQAQLAIVSWPTGLDRDAITGAMAEADARKILDTWGVGRAGVDDGLVLVFDMDTTKQHGQIAFFVGQGYKDLYLTPDEARSIINDEMLPKAAEGDLDGALLAGLRTVDRVSQPGGNPDRAGRAVFNVILAAVVIGFGLMTLGLFLRTWWLRGRDARVPLIDNSVLLPSPPPGLTPALATVLRNDGVDREAFTAALVDLGHRGMVTFEEGGRFRKHVDLVVPAEPLEDPGSLEARRRPLGSAESQLRSSISGKADEPSSTVPGARVLTSERLKAGKGQELWQSFRKDLGRAAKAAGWFRDDPNRLTGRWAGVGIGVVIATLVFGWFFAFDTSESSELLRPERAFLVFPLLFVIGVGVAIAVASRFLAARTPDGAQTLAMALAYRNTLRYEIEAAKTIDEAVEHTKSRLPWITTPDLLTVWAVGLGLKDDVDKLIRETFEEAQRTGSSVWAPVWFSGSDGVGSMDVSSLVSSISTTSASSSGSGYGGGSSGGGGGASGGF